MRQLADVGPVADFPCHGVVFFLYLQRARRVVVVNVLAFVNEGYSRVRILFFPSSLDFLYTSGVLDDVPVDDLVSLLLIYEAPQVEILTSFCLGLDREAVLVEGITR